MDGTNWAAEIARLLSKVDLVVGILDRDRRSDWTLFELGQAWANNRRILLLAPKGTAEHIPSGLKGITTVRASASNREAIEFALDQLLAAPDRSHEFKGRVMSSSRTLGRRADEILVEARAAITNGEGRRLEVLVEQALREAGVEALASEPGNDRGVDLAVWSDALQPSIGNPLLIEIKTRIVNPDAARRSAAQLFKHLAAAGTRWGLLLYGQGPTTGVLQHAVPQSVLVLSVEELLSGMRLRTFAEVVNDLRNRQVHGMGSSGSD